MAKGVAAKGIYLPRFLRRGHFLQLFFGHSLQGFLCLLIGLIYGFSHFLNQSIATCLCSGVTACAIPMATSIFSLSLAPALL